MDDDSQQLAILGVPAQGAINPQTRIDNGEISEDQLNDAIQSLDKHYILLDDQLDAVLKTPKWCVDGRIDLEGAELAPSAAGGTYSLVIGEALIEAPRLIAHKQTSATHGTELFADLFKKGHQIGGHQDNHATQEKCGCGACDRMGEIIDFLAGHIDELSDKAAELGVAIDADLKAQIKNNAQLLLDASYIASGPTMIETLKAAAGEKSVQTLRDAHNEVMLVVNTQENTTLDRRSLAKQFTEAYQAFNLDVWALKNGMDAISSTSDEAAKKFAAAILYNLATACVLAGPSLRVVIR